jgi:hypothetical protein
MLTRHELDGLEIAELPEREAMSLANINAFIPINAAVALNALSDGAAAISNANQTAPASQGQFMSNLLGAPPPAAPPAPPAPPAP